MQDTVSSQSIPDITGREKHDLSLQSTKQDQDIPGLTSRAISGQSGLQLSEYSLGKSVPSRQSLTHEDLSEGIFKLNDLKE